MVPRYFVDTSAWYALIDSQDPDHDKVSKCIQEYPSFLITSDYIFDETITLLRYRLGWKVAHIFGTTLLSGQCGAILSINNQDKIHAWKFFSKYRDQKFSFTDCTSFALLKRLKVTTVIALDSDFGALGFTCYP